MGLAAAAPKTAIGLRWRAPSRTDVTIAAAVAAAQVAFTTLAAAHQSGGHEALDPAAYSLLALSAASLAFRRRQPLAVLAFVFACTLAYWLLDYPRGPVFIALVVAFGTVAVMGYRLIAWATLALGYAAFLGLGALTGTGDITPGRALGLAAWLLVLGAGTELLRARFERAAEARRRRRQETLRRVGEERLRIARELHDVLAHNVSLINVQAGVALHLLHKDSSDPHQAESALAAIKQASAETLREMRAVLGTLRQVDEQAPRSPAPSLAGLAGLLAKMRAAGLRVELRIEGEQRPLAPAVDLAAYRIAQEALTNVARHSPGAGAWVRIEYRDRALLIEVFDDGASPRAVVAGNGIVGMRERALALGGEFSAGVGPDGGFLVRARLPLEGSK